MIENSDECKQRRNSTTKNIGRYEYVDIGKLIAYKNNARTHSQDQIQQLQSSIKEFGFINPILIDGDYNIIAGHGRVAAAKNEGMTKVPCLFIEHLTEAQKKAYVIADNKLAENAGWDTKLLKSELNELQEMDFNVELTGFDIDILAEPEALNLDEEIENGGEGGNTTVYHCPKCGFEFEAGQ
jgi:ParB-like chromosome segregation protein Spo0J